MLVPVHFYHPGHFLHNPVLVETYFFINWVSDEVLR